MNLIIKKSNKYLYIHMLSRDKRLILFTVSNLCKYLKFLNLKKIHCFLGKLAALKARLFCIRNILTLKKLRGKKKLVFENFLKYFYE
ncbi:hypothetical protein [Candidatus Vidania fulgoroideorum]